MKLDIKKIIAALEPVKNKIVQYQSLLIILVIVGIFGFIFFRIGYFSRLEPSESAVEDQLRSSQRPVIDKTVVDKLEKLQNQNIQVQALFNQARDNPFKE